MPMHRDWPTFLGFPTEIRLSNKLCESPEMVLLMG